MSDDMKELIEQNNSKEEKLLLQYVLNKAGLDTSFMIQEIFLGYKYRKRVGKLYESDGYIPTNLIKLYYSLNPTDIEFDKMKKGFITRYVKNESELEGVNDLDIHGHDEILGMADMYEYLHSDEMEQYFSMYSLKDLHRKLMGHTEHPECSGNFRTFPAYLPGTGIELAEWTMIQRELYALSPKIDYLHEYAKVVKATGDVKELLDFLDQCIELKVELIRIHPFSDGNGRTIRAFINKLLEDAGLPPIYVKANERTEYHTAMNKALLDKDYSSINAFYRYKICDSIIELDINDRVKKGNKELGVHKRTEESSKQKTKD